MPQAASSSNATSVTLAMPPDCSLRSMETVAASARDLLAAGRPASLDCSQVEAADIAFVQLVVSARRSFAARDLALTVEGAPVVVISAFARAGVPLPGAASSSFGR